MKLTPALPPLATAALTLVFALLIVAAPVSHAADRRREPARPPQGEAPVPQPPRMDPQTGLPLPPPRPWIDPTWQEPDKVLPQVTFDGLPLSEVAQFLRTEFKDAFDVLIPSGWQETAEQPKAYDPGNFTIKLQLKHVTASEVFNAMNLVLEGENTPVRWELKMNGNRPTAVLRYLPDLLPRNPLMQANLEPPKRMVYFVGDLLLDEPSGGMNMEQLFDTITQVYRMSFGNRPNRLQFHKDAQLLVFTGAADEIDFIQSTLTAMRNKAQMQRRPRGGGGFGAGFGGARPVEPNPNTETPVPNRGAGSPAPGRGPAPNPGSGFGPNPGPAPNPKGAPNE